MKPEKGETCALCHLPMPPVAPGWVRSLAGWVCARCWAALAPASAPYWQDWTKDAATPGQKRTVARLRAGKAGRIK